MSTRFSASKSTETPATKAIYHEDGDLLVVSFLGRRISSAVVLQSAQCLVIAKLNDGNALRELEVHTPQKKVNGSLEAPPTVQSTSEIVWTGTDDMIVCGVVASFWPASGLCRVKFELPDPEPCRYYKLGESLVAGLGKGGELMEFVILNIETKS